MKEVKWLTSQRRKTIEQDYASITVNAQPNQIELEQMNDSIVVDFKAIPELVQHLTALYDRALFEIGRREIHDPKS